MSKNVASVKVIFVHHIGTNEHFVLYARDLRGHHLQDNRLKLIHLTLTGVSDIGKPAPISQPSKRLMDAFISQKNVHYCRYSF